MSGFFIRDRRGRFETKRDTGKEQPGRHGSRDCNDDLTGQGRPGTTRSLKRQRNIPI